MCVCCLYVEVWLQNISIPFKNLWTSKSCYVARLNGQDIWENKHQSNKSEGKWSNMVLMCYLCHVSMIK